MFLTDGWDVGHKASTQCCLGTAGSFTGRGSRGPGPSSSKLASSCQECLCALGVSVQESGSPEADTKDTASLFMSTTGRCSGKAEAPGGLLTQEEVPRGPPGSPLCAPPAVVTLSRYSPAPPPF